PSLMAFTFCIDQSQVCDFVKQCIETGRDEANCSYQSFGVGWRDVSEGFDRWSIDRKSGEAAVKTQDGEGLSDRAVLRSLPFGRTVASCVMRFNYHLDQPDRDSLQLQLVWSTKAPPILLFSSQKALSKAKPGKKPTHASCQPGRVFIGE